MRTPALFLLTPAICLSQPAPAPAPASAPAPAISFDATNFDFGKIPGDNKVAHRFKVTDTGKAPLNITSLNPSCGCTSTVLGKWTLMPGESTEIEVTFNPAGYRGEARKSIQVVSNDPNQPTAVLTFEAEVVREVMASTDSVFFQDVVRNLTRKASVLFSSGTGKQVKVTGFKQFNTPYLSFAARQDGNNAWVDITLDASKAPAGKTLGADVVVVRTNSPKVPEIPITVQWETRATVVADPVRVAWAGEAAGRELRSTVTIRQVDDKPFRILSATSNNNLVKVEGFTDAAAVKHEVEVVLSAQAGPGVYNAEVILTLDDPGQKTLPLHIAASLR